MPRTVGVDLNENFHKLQKSDGFAAVLSRAVQRKHPSTLLPPYLRALSVALALVVSISVAVGSARATQAEVFAPGVISGADNDFAPAFLPNSSLVLFSRKSDAGISIMISTRRGSTWSPPTVAPFSGRWVDLEAALSPDGSYAIFASNRPIAEGGDELVSSYGGKRQTGGNLWRVDFNLGRWGTPHRLPANLNDQSSVWTPSIAQDGTLYFMSSDPVTARFRLHFAPNLKGKYGPVRDLPFSTGEFNDVDPAVDPAQRFLVFSSDRAFPGAGLEAGPERLFIAFGLRSSPLLVCPLTISGWEDTRLSQTEARFSPDGRTLYFASRRLAHSAAESPRSDWDNGKTNIWMIPFRATLWSASPGASPSCRWHS
jgi:Tol biopolymer transport system component